MGKPAILAGGDDPVVSAAAASGWRGRYGTGNRIALPPTGWLGCYVAGRGEGVVTGHVLPGSARSEAWARLSAPFAVETNAPGVLGAGDVRLDSVKRVAAVVGAGAMSACRVRRYRARI